MISHFFDKHGRALDCVKNIEREEGVRSLASFHLMLSWTSCVVVFLGKYCLMQCLSVCVDCQIGQMWCVLCLTAVGTCCKQSEQRFWTQSSVPAVWQYDNVAHNGFQLAHSWTLIAACVCVCGNTIYISSYIIFIFFLCIWWSLRIRHGSKPLT